MDDPTVLRGEGRRPGSPAEPLTVTLTADGFTMALAADPPWAAAYRDVTSVVVDAGAVLLQLGAGPGAERWILERFGPGLTTLVRGLRDGRLRQWLADGLVELPDDAPIELVETDLDRGVTVAQLSYDARGATLAPLDEGRPRYRVRRADIGSVTAEPEQGSVRIEGVAGAPLARGVPATSGGPVVSGEPDPASRIDGASPAELPGVALRGLGPAAASHAGRWSALRDGAATDIAAIVGRLLPDAPFAIRRRAMDVLREGRPADPAALGPAWEPLERAVLVEPAFAESYRWLVERAGGASSARWLAVAPERPAAPEAPRLWSLVGLPGNLLAMELVSSGAHATYLFRVVPRRVFAGGSADAAAPAAAVRDVSEALVDARFLREPMALPEARLAEAPYLRYRLALAALPSLAAARARFVARVVHRDPAGWAAALDDLIAWHGSARDDAAEWPGRSAQEAAIDEAADTDGDGAPATADETADAGAAGVDATGG